MKGIRRVIVGHLGDVRPIDYGGGVVVRVSQGGRSHLILEHTDGMESEHPEAAGLSDAQERRAELTVYRRDIADDVLADLNWVNWKAVSSSQGIGLDTIESDARSADPMLRAFVYELAASHHGWHELDTDPLVLTNAALRRRWKM
jgi:hypothetical protein